MEEVDNIVQITWSTSFPHGAEFLCEEFLERIAAHGPRRGQPVRVRVRYLSQYCRADDQFVSRQVKLYAGCARRVARSPVVDAPLDGLARCADAKIRGPVRKVNTRFGGDQPENAFDNRREIIGEQWPLRQDAEVEVFRETIRLDVAFL